MQRSTSSQDEALLKQHYAEQPHFGGHGKSAPSGYPGTTTSGQQFHPYQGQVSRFNNNVGALSVHDQQAIQSNPRQFWQWYYNSTSLGTVRAFEGPSPRGDRREHVVRFLNALYQNNIGAHVGAGNPLSGIFAQNQHGQLQIGNRGFFDLTAIPQNYLDPRYEWQPEHILAAKQQYMNRLWGNSEIQALIQQGYTWENGLGVLLNDLTNQFFDTLDHMKQTGIHIEVTPVGTGAGVERYHIEMNWDGQYRRIDYLALSHWDDFAGMMFDSEKVAQLSSFYRDNYSQSNFGVNCAAGLGRTGVIAMAFELLSHYDHFYDAQGIPDIAKIDECLARMRTERPGVIQTHEQYTLAISLANQMHMSQVYNVKLSDDQLAQINGVTTQAIVAYQQKMQYVAMPPQPQPQQQQPQQQQPQQQQPQQQQPQQQQPQQQQSHHHPLPKFTTTTPVVMVTPIKSETAIKENDFELLKKSRICSGELPVYAKAINVLITNGQDKVVSKLLNKLTVNDRRGVLGELISINPTFVQQYKDQSRKSILIDVIKTRRKALNEKVDEIERDLRQKR